jgi:hypothetical protein
MTTSTDLIVKPAPSTAVVGPDRNPRVIDGEVTGSWIPRPILPILAGSGALLAMGLAALVQEAIR